MLNIVSAYCAHCQHIRMQYGQLLACEPAERNGVTGLEKKKIGFCITAETSGMCCNIVA